MLKLGKTGRHLFRLPPETAVETMAVLGQRGSGKSFTASVFAEEFLKLGVQVLIVDPTDVWWGLRSSIDGDSEGFPITVLGGPHGDLPLTMEREAQTGALLANFAVEHRASLILSLRHLRKNRQREFVTQFAEQLYHRKGEAQHRTPVFTVIDEASAFVPQRVFKGAERMVGAIEDLVRRGRASGIGVCLVDQRPASVNKDALTQLSTLVCHRVTAPHDQKALREWIQLHDSESREAAFLRELASLPTGEAYFWSPTLDVFQRVAVRMRETFDSSKTPKLGEEPELPDRVAEVDLEELRGRLAATIEEAEANDPRKLKRRIAELERELREEAARECECDDIPALLEQIRDRERLLEEERRATGELRESLCDRLLGLADQARGAVAPIDAGLRELAGVLLDAKPPPPIQAAPPRTATPGRPKETAPFVPPKPASSDPDPGAEEGILEALTPAQRRMLDALATVEALGVQSLDQRSLAVFSGQSPKSSAYREHLARLVKFGWAERPDPGRIALTANGRAEGVPQVDGVRDLSTLHAAWCQYLGDAKTAIIRQLAARHPDEMWREDLAKAAGMSPRSSAYREHVGQLTKLGLVERAGAGRVRASTLLFPDWAAR